MTRSYPCIKVYDMETTLDWYDHFLGFHCTYKSALENPDNALIEKDKQKIYFIKDEADDAYAPQVIIIEVPDLKAEYCALDKAGVIFVQVIKKGVFSGKEFVIKDYEENKIIYLQKTYERG